MTDNYKVKNSNLYFNDINKDIDNFLSFKKIIKISKDKNLLGDSLPLINKKQAGSKIKI